MNNEFSHIVKKVRNISQKVEKKLIANIIWKADQYIEKNHFHFTRAYFWDIYHPFPHPL